MATNTQSVLDQFTEFVAPTYGRFPLVLERGQGAHVWDVEGRRFLDFGTGIAVCSLGHAHPAMAKTFAEEAAKLVHVSNLYHVPAQAELAKLLVEIVGSPGKVFFCNSGAEANEGMFKLARRYGNLTAPGQRHEIITFHNSFHGRTLAGIAATGQDKVRTGFDPVTPGFRHLPYNDLEAVKAALHEGTVAIMLESIQGEGGIHPAEPEFLRGLRALCDQHDLLLLIDEVQCGLGRTGDWCAWKGLGAAEIVPDAVAWAKGIAGGYPLGAIWFSSQRQVQLQNGDSTSLADLLGPGTHGTTYGGGPLGCQIALTVLNTLQHEQYLPQVQTMGHRLVEGIQCWKSPLIQQIRGRGLMIGIELEPDAVREQFDLDETTPPAKAVTLACMEAGLLVVPSLPNTIRLLPPLTIGVAEVDECLSLLKSILAPKTKTQSTMAESLIG